MVAREESLVVFEPPRCPNADCAMHRQPEPFFFHRNGSYRTLHRERPIPRFRCKRCARRFSEQTFRMDYRDQRPDVNALLFALLISGVGLRQSARLIGLSLWATQLKFRKIARHLKLFNQLHLGTLPADATLQMDEIEWYEGRRKTRPVTIPIVIDRKTRFVISARSAPIRPGGKKPPDRQRAIAADEARFGRRPSRSRPAVRRALRKAEAISSAMTTVVLETDEKSSYGPLAREVFGEARLRHVKTSSRLPRTSWNPLFPINHMEANLRCNAGRLRRDSWLTSKRRWFLNLYLEMWIAWRNFVRVRFNGERHSPAQLLGFVDGRLTINHLLSWRQDWGSLSPPLAAAV